MALLFALLICVAFFFLLVKKRQKSHKKEYPIIDADTPTITYKVDIINELDRIQNEQKQGKSFIENSETVKEIELSKLIDDLAYDISHVSSVVNSLENDPSPYPTRVLTEIEGIISAHNRVLDSRKKKYYNKAILVAKNNINDSQIIKTIDSYSADPKALNLESFKLSLLDKFFYNYKSYWESHISNLKRESAIINRRKYLVEKCVEWKGVLAKQKIKRYNTILDDYYNYNLFELNRLEQA